MQAAMLIVASALLGSGLISMAEGHGRQLEPPSRQSMWRQGFNTPVNYDDHALYCGGRENQWNFQGGKCGVCGDPYQGPRRYERPDGSGVPSELIIGKTYTEGQTIDVEIQVTVNHLGWFEFRICDMKDVEPLEEATHECLDRHLLKNATGHTQFGIGTAVGLLKYRLVLPQGLTCTHCFMQWKWHCGNSPGYGQAQEEFYACSDIAIKPNNGELPATTRRPATRAPVTTTPRPTTTTTRRPTATTTTRRPTTTTTRRPTTLPTSTRRRPTSPTQQPPKPKTTIDYGYKNVDEHLINVIKPAPSEEEKKKEAKDALSYFLNGPKKSEPAVRFPLNIKGVAT